MRSSDTVTTNGAAADTTRYPQTGRVQAGKDAGLSRRQTVTANRVARVSDPDFEEAVHGPR